MKSFLGNFCRHLAIVFWPHWSIHTFQLRSAFMSGASPSVKASDASRALNMTQKISPAMVDLCAALRPPPLSACHVRPQKYLMRSYGALQSNELLLACHVTFQFNKKLGCFVEQSLPIGCVKRPSFLLKSEVTITHLTTKHYLPSYKNVQFHSGQSAYKIHKWIICIKHSTAIAKILFLLCTSYQRHT